MDSLEQKALDAVKDVKQWRKIMRDTISVLRKDLRQRMRKATWKHKDKMVIGDGIILVWQIRRYPNLPISYDNQQTSIGFVAVYSFQK